MEKISLYDIYNEISHEYTSVNNLIPIEEKKSKNDFNATLLKAKFIIIPYKTDKKIIAEEKIEIPSEDESESASFENSKAFQQVETEQIKGSAEKKKIKVKHSKNYKSKNSQAESSFENNSLFSEESNNSNISTSKSELKIKKQNVIVLLIYCQAAIFNNSESYKKIKSAIKIRDKKNEYEVLVIHEYSDDILTNLNNFILSINEICYATYISTSSFISFTGHIYTPSFYKILTDEEKRRDFSLLHLNKKIISTIHWLNPLVIFLRARVGSVISINQNGTTSGLCHKYLIVVQK